jgi:beta-glucosidase
MAVVIGKEARAYGVNQIFAPVADLARELRHGRVEEMYGECSYLRQVLPANEYSRMVYHLRVAYSHFIPFQACLGSTALETLCLLLRSPQIT